MSKCRLEALAPFDGLLAAGAQDSVRDEALRRRLWRRSGQASTSSASPQDERYGSSHHHHNPRCSKSCATLALLKQAGADVTIIDYLATPPTAADLARLVARVNLPPRAILCPGAPPLEEDAILDAVAADPTLLERPIVETTRGVVLARPPERAREIL